MDDSFNFLSHTSFQNKYNLRVKPLTFFGMIAAINHLRIQIARNQPDSHESFSSDFMKSTKPPDLYIRSYYQNGVKNPYQFNKNGNRISTLIKKSTGKQFTSWRLTAQTAQNVLFLILNFYIGDYQPTVSYIN